MKDVLIKLLYLLITGCGTTLVSFLCVFIKKKINEVTTKVQCEKVSYYVDAALTTVSDAVLTVSQTYVDSLKKNGTFTSEAQKEAKEKAIELSNKLITEDGKAAVERIYGDFSTWLNTTIESTVKSNK